MKTNSLIAVIGGLLLVSCSGQYAIYGAAAKGNIAKIEQCLANGDNVNIATRQGMTPLIIASQKGYGDTVSYLLKHGADIEAKDEDGLTALGHAQLQGNNSVAGILLAAGANKGNSGYAPAPSSIVGKTLVLDLRKCNYRISIPWAQPGTVEYSDAYSDARRAVDAKDWDKFSFYGGGQYTLDGRRVGHTSYSGYSYSSSSRKATIRMMNCDMEYTITLTFMTPTSGMATFDACEGGDSASIYYSKVAFTLK